jgi:hypothetical protein
VANRSARRAIASENRRQLMQQAKNAYTPPRSLPGRVGSWLMASAGKLLPSAEIREMFTLTLAGGIVVGLTIAAGVWFLLAVLKVPR